MLLILISAYGALAQNQATAVAKSQTPNCTVFADPRMFVGRNVTVQGAIGDRHGFVELVPMPTCSNHVYTFNLIWRDEELNNSETGRRFIQDLTEAAPQGSDEICIGCKRYRITRVVVLGRIIEGQSAKVADIVIDASKDVSPYSIDIKQVLDIVTEEIKRDFKAPSVLPLRRLPEVLAPQGFMILTTAHESRS